MRYFKFFGLISVVALTSACQNLASTDVAPEMQENARTSEAAINHEVMKSVEAKDAVVNKDVNNHQLFEVHKDGRIYVFYDFTSYQDFLKLNHTPFVLTKIGAGPKGETIVYALTSDDKAKREGIVSVDMMEGRIAPAEDFYAEINMDGRTYVFNRLKDMSDVRKLGEAPFRYAKIGYGKNGESVVFVLNDTNKTVYPEALIKKYDDLNK